jgi:hypothetical protein
MMKTFLATTALALTLVAGCYVAATTEDYRWSVKAPSKVSLESKLTFTVEARAPDGAAAIGVPYVWRVDWVGVKGTRHQGHSSDEERITVKGDPGTAVVRILVLDQAHHLVEVARATFEVTASQLPAE